MFPVFSLLFFSMFSSGLHPLPPRHKDYLSARKAERAAAWERRSCFWPVEDLRRLEPSATSLPRQPFVPPDPNALRATYLRYRDALLEAGCWALGAGWGWAGRRDPSGIFIFFKLCKIKICCMIHDMYS